MSTEKRSDALSFSVTIKAPDCNCQDSGKDGTRRHSGPRTLLAQRLFAGGQSTPISACQNHLQNYKRNLLLFRVIEDVQPVEPPLPLLRTVRVPSSTGKMRTLVVRRAVSGQPVWYVLSDSGADEYLVQFRRGIWLCECKHFIGRAFARNQTCHHIDGVRQADPSAVAIENGN